MKTYKIAVLGLIMTAFFSFGVSQASAFELSNSGVLPKVGGSMCKTTGEYETEWHFNINQITAGTQPASITVTFANAGTFEIPFWKLTGGNAHYLLATSTMPALYPGILTDTLLSASAVVPEGYSGNFVLSHWPCIKPLVVTKTATTAFDRNWNWTINKTADTNTLTLADSQQMPVNYTIAVDTTSADSNWNVSGVVTVANPLDNPSATIESISDVMSTAGSVALDCGITFPYVLPSGSSLSCTYNQTLTGPVDQTNTATVAVSGLAIGSSTSTPVTFSTLPTNEYDECVTLSDTNTKGPQQQVCATDTQKNFTYTVTFGKDAGADVNLVCGITNYGNTAAFTTNDTAATSSKTWTVDATVACSLGCTLTQGYWKTHNVSFNGGARPDDAWNLIGAGAENTLFGVSGKSWFTNFWTAPAGNVYYNLAHQFMAATLNKLNGASTPASVTAALTSAGNLLNSTTPASAANLKGAQKTTWTTLAGILGSYNEGTTGPGHCSE